MRKDIVVPFLIIVFFAFGCGSLDRLRSVQNDAANANRSTVAATATPTPSAAPSASPSPLDKASLGVNWLAFGAGAIVAGKTSESRSSDSAARQLIDESGFSWMTADGQIENQSVTLELPARTTLKTVVFDTGQPTYYDGRGARDVSVEVSDESATSGFQTILEATLQDSKSKNGVDDQTFPVQKEIAGRFVRYTAKNNFGSPVTILTEEVSGYGEQEARAAIANISGTYKLEGTGDVHLKQEGNAVIGCYEENEGIVEGAIDGRVITLVASNKDSRAKNEKSSYVAANVVNDGKTIVTTWWGWSATPVKKSYDRFYIAEKTLDKIGSCKHLPDLNGTKDVAKENLEKEIEANGKAILYGINFNFNSDVIRPESKPTLDKVIAILKDKTGWQFAVGGHTDNIGGDSFNQTLSEKRAASVVKYLTDGGITADRLSSNGYGLTRPLAPNDSEAERAQNRRVELVKR